MRTLRLIGRGLSDTLESLLPFTLLTLAWWVCLFLVIPAPAATVTLAAMADPRRAVDRPDWREALGAVRRNLWRGWGVVLAPLPFVAVLLANLSFYGGRTEPLGRAGTVVDVAALVRARRRPLCLRRRRFD